ncbi:MAG TPA: sigma-70 family RNA polymerase sigma factor [Galbitalea sp.]|jgi:RNA polymerase sigma-70 factor (ECF subfamily)|nr:sigma-70 family RNA polymerase sigma factor [Galbitalea sp.]
MRSVFEENAADLLTYLERRIDPRSGAADVLGDAMVIAWKKAGQLPSEPEQARMWLFVIARNTLLNHRRSLGRQRAAVDRLREIIDQHHPPLSEFDRADSQATIRNALASLPSSEQELVRLVNWDGFKLSEVAQLEGIAPSTVRSRYAKALSSLATLLEDEAMSTSARAIRKG